MKLNSGSGDEAAVTAYRDFFAAHEAAAKLRTIAGDGVAVRVERSGYGRGYVVRQFPVELLTDPDSPTFRLGNLASRSYGAVRPYA